MTRWADSGAMALTGLPDHPMGPPAGLVEGIDRVARSFPGVDALALLGERAALMGLWRRGTTSCGGSCRLLPCGDGFMAVSLPRADDMETVPAWLELDVVPESVPAMWSAVASHLQHGDPDSLLARAHLLGLPAALVGESAGQRRRCPVAARRGLAAARPERAWSSSTSRRSGRAHCAATSWRAPAPRRQGRVDAAAGWRASGPGGVLRPVERAQEVRCAWIFGATMASASCAACSDMPMS